MKSGSSNSASRTRPTPSANGRRRGSTGTGQFVPEGFNAKKQMRRTSVGYDKSGDPKMKLNTKPYSSSSPTATAKPKLSTEGVVKKMQLNGFLGAGRRGTNNGPVDETGSTLNLMDDQSIASGYLDTTDTAMVRKQRQKSLLNMTHARESALAHQTKRQQAEKTTINGKNRLTNSSDHSRGSGRGTSKAMNDNSHGSRGSGGDQKSTSTDTTTDPIDMFEDLATRKKSPDLFQNRDAFATNTFRATTYSKPPAVQRATAIDEDAAANAMSYNDSSNSLDTDTNTEDNRQSGSSKPKKSKIQKITELLAEKKIMVHKYKALRKDCLAQSERVEELEQKLEVSGDLGTRAEILKSVAEQDEVLRQTKRELEKAQRDTKLFKKQFSLKKAENAKMEKEVEANMTEISTLRKELSQALQQVDMLEEELMGDKEKIIHLTKNGSAPDDASQDVSTLKEQVELLQNEGRKKDRLLEKQRLEIENQTEAAHRLREVAKRSAAQSDQTDRIAELTETNDELRKQLDLQARVLEDATKREAKAAAEHSKAARESERKQRLLAEELQELKEEAVSTSRAIGNDSDDAGRLKRDLKAANTALEASKRRAELIISQNEESRQQLKDTIGQLEEQNMELQLKAAESSKQDSTTEELAECNKKLQDEVDNLTGDIQTYEDTVMELEDQLASDRKEHEREVEGMKEQIDSLRGSLEASQRLNNQSVDEAKKGVNDLQSKIADIEMKLQESKRQNADMEAKLDSLRTENAKLDEGVMDLKETNGQLEEEVSALLSERDDLAEQLAQASEMADTVNEVQNRLVEVQERAFQLSELNRALEIKVEDLQLDKEELQDDYDEIENDAAEAGQAVTALENLMEEFEALQEEAEGLREKLTATDGELEQLRTENVEWQAAVDRAEAEVAESQAVIPLVEATQQDLEALQGEYELLEEKKIQLDVRVKELTTQNETLQTSLQTASDDLDVASDMISDLEDEKARLLEFEKSALESEAAAEARIEELTQEKDDWADAAKEAAADADYQQSIVSELKASNQNFSTFQVEAAELRALRDSNEATIRDLTADRDQLKSALKEANAELKQTQSALTTFEEVMKEYEDLQEDAEKLRLDNGDLDTQLKQLATDKEELENAASKAAADAFELKANIDQLEKDHESKEAEHEAHLRELQEKNTSLVVELSELETNLGLMKKRVTESEDNEVQAKTTHSELQKRVNDLEAKTKQLDEANAEFISEIEALTEECDSAKHNAENVKRELEEVLHSKKALEEQLEEHQLLVDELATLKTQQEQSLMDLEEAMLREESLDSELKNLQSQHKELESMLDASKQEARDAVSAAQALEEEMKHRRQADQDALNGKVGVVKSQLNEVLQERSELKVALSRAEDELEGARSDNADLQSDVDKLRQETATLGATTATLTSQVASLKSERDNLKSVADMSEARSIEVQNNSASLAEVRKELSAVQQEADTLRTQNMEAMMQVADLQAEQDKLRRAAAGGQEAAESSKVLRASEQRVTELEQRNQQMADEIDALVKECDDLRDHVDQSANSSAMPSAAALQEKLTEVTRERDELQESLAQNGAKERTGSLDRSDRSYANTLRDDFSEIRETLNCGHNEDVAVAVRYLQNDYADLIDDHDHLKLAAAGYEAEIEALMHERDEWMEKAQSCTDATPGTSPETSRSTAGPSGGENLQETCDDLQRQLQALVRDRDLWRETAESAERRNPGRGMERRPSFGSVGSHMSDNSAQQMLLIQAKEYREKRDGKNKSSWGFSRRAASKNDDPEDIDEDMPDREELIDKLLDTNSSYKEAIKKLKKDIVALNTSLKEDAYSSKKKIDELTHEMSAHELKVMLLEQEIERLQDEAKKSSSGSAQQNSSSDEVERKLKQTEQQKSEVEKELRSLKDAYFKLKQEYETETAAKTSEIEHLKTLQKDFEAKADALENMMDAINQENETLREIAQKNANFSIDSELGKQLAQDDKDVKIAQLNHALIDLRMQGHQQLKDEVDRLQNEKRQTQEAMQQHFAVVEEETNTLVEDLETKLEAREMTIKQLEQMLDMIQASG